MHSHLQANINLIQELNINTAILSYIIKKNQEFNVNHKKTPKSLYIYLSDPSIVEITEKDFLDFQKLYYYPNFNLEKNLILLEDSIFKNNILPLHTTNNEKIQCH